MDNEYKPQEGIWTLTAPDGTQWTGDSPLNVVSIEINQRVPANIRAKRVLKALNETTCVWTLMNEDALIDRSYDAGCNNAFQLNEGTPEDNHMEYCPFCGGVIQIT